MKDALQGGNAKSRASEKYITGYRGFVARDGLKREPIDTLYDDLRGLSINPPDTQTWWFRRDGVKMAKEYFGQFNKWLIMQHQSGYLYDNRLAFLADTLRFISMGKRRIAARNWIDILEVDPKMAAHEVPSKQEFEKIVASYALPINDTAAIIRMWCSHPSGFDDMVCTLNIVFGGKGQRAVSTA